MSRQFWLNDPTILLNKDSMFELWPSSNMCFESKLNAITRLILILTVLGFIITMSFKIVIVGLVTIAVIVLFYKTKKDKIIDKVKSVNEGFTNPGVTIGDETNILTGGEKIINPETLDSFLKSEFKIAILTFSKFF